MLEINKFRYVNRVLLLSLMVICLSLSRETSLLQAQQDSTDLSASDTLAQKVLQYVAQTHQLSLEELELHDQGHAVYPLTGRSFQTFFILSHRPEPAPPEYAIWVDESTGQFLAETDIQIIEAAEKTAHQHKYGPLSPRLYERLQQIEAQDILPIAIWVAGTQPSPEEIYAEVTTAYPAAQAALTEGLHPRQLEDATLAQTVEQAFDQRLAHYASQRTQSLVAMLQAEQVPIQTISGMPSVVTKPPKH